MQSDYPGKTHVQWLEEIVSRKNVELNQSEAIRSNNPGLEAVYVQLLNEWNIVLATTRDYAEQARNVALADPRHALPSEWAATVPMLIEGSAVQSTEFERQLNLMHERSSALVRDFSPATNEDSSDGYDGPEPADASLHTRPFIDAVPIGGHRLPPLPYTYKALEPYIDEKTMRIHHDKHHQSYVDGLNNAEKKLAEARQTGNFDLVKHWERELAFNGAGHYLHTLFWDVMSPQGGGKPTGALLDEINNSFGSYDAFKKQFTEAANKVEGGGWAILVWSPRSHRLEILTAEKHQNLSQWDVVPLLPLDVWEHAYYLKHQNDRAAYIQDWWKVVNWPYVSMRYDQACRLQWVPF
jgi:superoxide dismutase, Fe-Mn family